jgi:hypothetical protein
MVSQPAPSVSLDAHEITNCDHKMGVGCIEL